MLTTEELRKEATETVEWEYTPMIDRPTFINGYITGAEPREKRITELEKENDRLSRKCECLTNNNESLIDIVNDVERLEKENESLTNIKNIYVGDLLKAKELLKWALHSDPEHDEDFEKKWEEAEQFLKENE